MKRFFSALICFVLVFQLLGIDQAFALDEESTPDGSEIVVTEGTMDLKSYGLDPDDFYSKMLVDMKVTGSKKAELMLDLNLNNAFLTKRMDELEEKINNGEITVETPDEPNISDFGGDEDNPAYQDAMNKYLIDLYNSYSDADLPTKEFQITLDGSVFGEITTAKDVELSFDDAGRKRPIGTYSIEKNSDGNYVLSVKFNKVVYGFSDIHAVIYCISTFKNVVTEKQNVYLKLIPPKKMISVEIKDKEEPVKPVKGTFSISKTAPETVSTPYIDYTIVAKVKDGNFDNTTVVDNIPEGLYVKSAELDGTPLEESDYTIQDGVFEYTFHDSEPTKVYTENQKNLKLRCYLTPENYALYASSSGTFVKNFTNESYLKSVKDNETLTKPAYAKTKMSATFITKEGCSGGLYGTRFDWTISVNSYFSNEMTGYLVDKIDNAAHNYAFITEDSASIVVSQLKAGEETEVETKVKPVKIDKTTKYEDLSMDILDEYTKVAGDSSERQSVYYDYVGEGGKTESICIIPFDSFTNSKVTLKYQTIRNTHGLPEKEFKDTTDVVCRNVAQMIWKFKDGVGAGLLPEYKIDCKKDISSKVALVQKKNYKAYKNLGYRWLICVNELGSTFTDIRFEDIKIEDVLLDNVQVYPKYIRENHEPLKAHYKAMLNAKNEFEDKGEETFIPYVDDKVDGKPYYTLEDVLVGGQKGTKLTIHIPKVDETENYFIEIQTRISDPNFFGKKASKYDLNNKIKWSAKSNLKECSGDSTAYRTARCSLVQKEGLVNGNAYNYKNNTTKWRTTLNHDQETVTKAALEEILPEGAVFHEMKEIVIYDTDNKTVLYQLSSEDGKTFIGKDNVEYNVEYNVEVKDDQTYVLVLPNGQTMSWKEGKGTKVLAAYDDLTVADNKLNVAFSDVTKNKISYTFTTYYEKDYRKIVLANKIYPTKGKVNFSGEVEGDPFVTDYVQDELKIYPIVLQKEGVFKEELGMVKWNIYLNQAQVDLKGYTVRDAIKDIFDLESDSFRVFKCGVESDSSLTAEKEISSEVISSFGTEDKSGFTFDIPDEYSNDTLLIQYDTYLCSNITKELATNKAFLENDKGIYRETNEIMPKNMKDFNIMNFVLASPYNTLFIEKVSTNENGDNKKLTLPNCEFQVTQMDNKDGKWVENKSYNKFRTTKANGVATFLNMKKDVLYKIEEVSGIDGYKMMKEPKYLVLKRM